ncbi:MAG TPA: amino acid adenylation domain-containing protein, partial [Bryobacteraceae bacterium]|nr:amino acid adenylation domain-containing protein [Bryobacteraceae bacterium]
AAARETHALLTQLLRHEHATLALAQRCSLLQSPAPLFTSLLNYRHLRSEASAAAAGIEAPIGLEFLGGQERTNYPFGLSVNDLVESLSLGVKVDASIDPQRVCAMMHTALESLVTALETAPESALRRLRVLPEEERQQVLYAWNETQAEYGPHKSVHELFEEQAKRTPEATAAVFADRRASYNDLNRRANRLAHYLQDLGVKPDDRVGICMKRSLEMVVAVLGVLKAGGSYVPLDPSHPEERLQYMVEDAGATIVLTQQETAEVLPRSGVWLICMDEEEESARIERQREANPEPVAAMENLAYVIYTSGSTGKPKGVAIEHRQLANYVRAIARELQQLGLREGARYALVSTLSADLGNTVLYPSLVSGGELHLIGEEQVMDGERLGDYFERRQIDCVKIVPSHLQGLRAVKGGEKVIPRKVLVVGGEASAWTWAREWNAAGSCAVLNHYGPTETTVGALRYRLGTDTVADRAEGTVPIGQPLGNMRAYLLDQDLEPLPIGAAGELFIGGAGVGRGYVNRPELTAERFVPDPFSGFGQRLYRTGDLASRRADGNIEFLGRIDQQVKVRGYRIELGEIEAVLREHLAVKQAVVVAAESETGEKRLVAYVTPAAIAESGIDVDALRAHATSQLPEYMVPAAYVSLAKLPLTPNGKLDRKALPSPGAEAFVARGYEEPVNEVESTVAAIWAEVLQLERVGRNDNFFELGGHSLIAIQVIARLRQGLGVEIGITDLFDRPQVASLAEWIVDAQLATFNSDDLANVLKLMGDS